MYHLFPSGIPTDSGFKLKMLGLDLLCPVTLHFFFFFSSLLTDHSSLSELDPFLFFWRHLYSSYFHVSYHPHVNVLALMFLENFGLSPPKVTWTPVLPCVAVNNPVSLVMSLVSWLMWVSRFVGFFLHFLPISIFKFCPPRPLLRVQCRRSDISSPCPVMQNSKNRT